MEKELTKDFIDNLPLTNEKVIDKYIKIISKEISSDAKVIGIENARQNANMKHGKFWRERLSKKKIYNKATPFGKMSYY